MTPSSKPRKEDSVAYIAVQVSIGAHDGSRRPSSVEIVGYMLAYAEQTGAEMSVLRGPAATDDYKFLFRFGSPDSRFDFLHLLQLNDVTAREEEDFLTLTPDEIASARPISHVLPMDLVPKVLAFVDVLLGRCNNSSNL